MLLRLATIVFFILIFVFGQACSDIIEMSFSPDSLSQSNDGYNFTYNSLKTITINPNLSLPIGTIYLNSTDKTPEINVVSDNLFQHELGVIPADVQKLNNLITANDETELILPHRTISKFETVLYDKQIIKKQNSNIIALSILPITLDSSGRLILNRKIIISTETTVLNQIESKDLFSELEDIENLTARRISSSEEDTVQPKYVIITSNELAPYFSDLVDFKNATGIPTIVQTIESIYASYSGRDELEQIRNYLIEFYNNGGEYVLIGGNDAVVPIRYLYYYDTNTPPSNPYNLMPSDLYFADLSGDWDMDGDDIWGEPTHDAPDIEPELTLGRLPVMTPEAIENYISKLILYQTNPGNGDYDYLEKCLIFSSDQMRDYPAIGQHGYIANEQPDYIYTDTSETIEMPDGIDANPTNPNGAYGVEKISEGFGLIHILAHGRRDGFRVKASGYDDYPASLILTTPQTNGHGSLIDLEKNGKFSLYYSLSCQVGGFDLDSTNGEPSDWSFVESAIATEDAGAVGMVAYSRWGWVYSSYYLEASFAKHLYGQANGNPARAMYYSWLDYPYYRDLIYGQNYFGDPTFEFYRSKPLKLELEVTEAKGSTTFTTLIDDEATSDVTVVISQNGDILEAGLTDKLGRFQSAIELTYGNEYIFTAYKDSCTISRIVYTPSMTLDSEEDIDWQLPDKYSLGQNYPNPFNPSTTFEYSLPKSDYVILEIYNILGQVVSYHEIGELPPGTYSYSWNGTDSNNRPLSSGIYFYRLRTSEFIETKKMTLVK